MTEIKGKLEAFFETGTEGILWAVSENGKPGYDGLNILKDGDLLRVFKDEARTMILWEGEVNLDTANRWRPYPLNPAYGQQEVLGYWVHGLQTDLPPEQWAKWFFEERPASLVPKQPPSSPKP